MSQSLVHYIVTVLTLLFSYVVHSSFSLIFPLHLLLLLATTTHTSSSLLKGLAIAISKHLSPGEKFDPFRFPLQKFIRLTLAVTFGLTIPALLWFASVSLTS